MTDGVDRHEPLRILQVIETGGPGGAETVFASVCTGLRNRGHVLTCLVAPGSWLPAEMSRRGLPPLVLETHGAFDVALLRRMVGIIRTAQVDIVHAHLFEGALYAALAARLCGVPCVATLHGQVDLERGGWKSRIKRQLFGRTVSALVTVSDALRRDLAPLLPLPAGRVHVIPNGVARRDTTDVAPSDRGTADRTDSAPPQLIAIGNIRAPKNYPLLLEALRLLRREVPYVRLDILGEPDREGLFESLQRQVEQLGLSGAVTFHGFVADPSALLTRADAFVLSSSKEGFSLATIEAMLTGVPVVATRSGGPEEILRHRETGLLVPSGDPVALASALREVLQQPDLARSLVESAQRDASARYGIESMVAAYERLYRAVLADR